MKKMQAFIFILAMLCCQLAFAAPKIKGTLLYVPLDNRPVCLAYPVETMEAAGWEVKTPPLEYIAGAEKGGDPDALFDWLLEMLMNLWQWLFLLTLSFTEVWLIHAPTIFLWKY